MSNKIKVKMYVEDGGFIPKYQNDGDSGMDLHSNSKDSITIGPMSLRLVPTGLFVSIPDENWEFQVRSRSGLAAKYSVFTLNSPGTIDQSYRGEIKVILYNAGEKPFTVNYGDRISQIVLCPIGKVEAEVVTEYKELEQTKRSSNGFGSTGV